MESILTFIQHKQYAHAIRKCRDLETDILFANPNPVFYFLYIISHLLQNELPSARAVYSRIPSAIQETPTIKFVFSLLQQAWNRNYKGFYALISQVENGLIELEEPITSVTLMYKRHWQARTLALLEKAYTSIPPDKAAEYLGLSNDLIVQMLQQENWTYDDERKLLIPPKMEKQRKESKYETDFADFGKLTEIAMVLKGS